MKPDAAAIVGWLVQRLADVVELEVNEIDVDIPFERYGLDSRSAASLAGELEEWLGCSLPATLLWDYPTISEVVGVLQESLSESEGTGAESAG